MVDKEIKIETSADLTTNLVSLDMSTVPNFETPHYSNWYYDNGGVIAVTSPWRLGMMRDDPYCTGSSGAGGTNDGSFTEGRQCYNYGDPAVTKSFNPVSSYNSCDEDPLWEYQVFPVA